MFKLVEHNVTSGLYKANGTVPVQRDAPHNDVAVNDGSYIRIWSHKILLYYNTIVLVTAVAQWLRRCATNREVAGSIPDGVTGIFH